MCFQEYNQTSTLRCTMLTPEQEQRVKDAIGDGTDWPKATGDPQVNHRVDQLVSDPTLPDWELLLDEQRDLYEEEAIEYEEF